MWSRSFKNIYKNPKAAHEELAPSVTELFNKCIETKIVPNEWKLAKVTPLYKLKGIKTDLNNYRDISVLPPLGKLFEKVRATQIIIYFNMNNLFLLKLNLDSYRKSQNLLRQNKIKINMKIK